MEATANATERIDETALKESVRAAMQRLGMSQTRLSKESGINQARLSQWFSGKYPGNTEVVAHELARWLNSVQARAKDASRLSVTPDWKPTPTANNVVTALRYAQNAGDIALVYGGAGLGKTCTAKRYQEDNPNVWIATMTPAMNTVAACLERIAFSIGLPEAQSSAVKTENAIVARLEDTGGLLIVDEAQHLPVPVWMPSEVFMTPPVSALPCWATNRFTPALPAVPVRLTSRNCLAGLDTASS